MPDQQDELDRFGAELDALAALLAVRRSMANRDDPMSVRVLSRAVDHLIRGATAIDWRQMAQLTNRAADDLAADRGAPPPAELVDMMRLAAVYSHSAAT
jgi:hypothetical protein